MMTISRFGFIYQIFFRSDFEGGILLQKDPKRVLESFRVEEEDPLLHHRPRKFRKRKNELSQVSNTAILSLCLVTGLTSSVGSAFANSLDDQENHKAPLDEPPSKVELENKAPLQQQETPQNKSDEIIPTNPPLDEPASDVNKQQPENSKNKQKHIEEGSSETSKQKETKVSEKEKVPQKAEEKTNSDEKSSTSNKKESNKTPSAEQKPVTKDSSKPKQKEEKSAIPPTNEKEAKTNVIKEQKEEKQENTPAENTPTSQNDVILPVTEEGGELPETAGDDLNQVALGAGMALAGALLLKRKRAKS
jgi:hypothetical protein